RRSPLRRGVGVAPTAETPGATGGRRGNRVTSLIAVSTPYWRGAVEDQVMQDEHGFLWQAILETIDIDVTGLRVLDAGCNRGGFLRLLVDRSGIAERYGYD